MTVVKRTKSATSLEGNSELTYKLIKAYPKETGSKIGDVVVATPEGHPTTFYICTVSTDESNYCRSYSNLTDKGVGTECKKLTPFYIKLVKDLKKLVAVDKQGNVHDVPVKNWNKILKEIKKKEEDAEYTALTKDALGVRKLSAKEYNKIDLDKYVSMTKAEQKQAIEILEGQIVKTGSLETDKGFTEVRATQYLPGGYKFDVVSSYIGRPDSIANIKMPPNKHKGLFLDSLMVIKLKDGRYLVEFSEDSTRDDKECFLIAQTMSGLKDLQEVLLEIKL